MASVFYRVRSERSVLGFTLLELSIVVTIIAFMLGGTVAMFSAYTAKSIREDTDQRMRVIENALLNYRRANDRIPCPADITLATSVANFGVEAATAGTCTGGTPAANFSSGNSVAGMVPTKTLQLPDEYAFDSWGRRIMYAVDKRFTATGGFTTLDVSSSASLQVSSLDRNLQQLRFAKNQFEIFTDAYASPAATASFTRKDTTTHGSWVGAYGAEGYRISQEQTNDPAYATVSITNHANYTWLASTANVNALQKGLDHADRIAACWYKSGTFNINVNLTDGLTHNVSLYFIDWDNNGRSVRIDVYDADSNSLLDSQTLSAGAEYRNGVYYTWSVSGNIRFDAVMIAGANITVSGLFFDASVSPKVYVLYSAGENGHGAYPRTGGSTRINADITNTDELENCDCTGAGVSGAFNGAYINKPYSQNSSDQRDTFDDIVHFKERKDLLGWSEQP